MKANLKCHLLSTTLNMINFMKVRCDGLRFGNNPLFFRNAIMHINIIFCIILS
jgi:hypothetical protein